MANAELTIDELIDLLVKFKDEHKGDERLQLPVTVNQYEWYRRVYGIQFADVTDGCDGCKDDRCVYGGPKHRDAPADDDEAKAAGFQFEGVHWELELQYHEVD